MITIEKHIKTHDFQQYNNIIFSRIKERDNEYFRNKDVGNIHRYVWESFMKTPVPEGYCIHHIDEDTSNNHISNLQIMTRSDHMGLHTKNKKRTDKTKRKMSKAHIGNKLSKETRVKISEANKGKTWKVINNKRVWLGV